MSKLITSSIELSALMDKCKTNAELDALLLKAADSPKKILSALIGSYRANFDDLENPEPDKLPEKVIVSSGCHDCPFVQTRNDYCTVGRNDDQGGLNINGYFLDKEFHPQCPLLTNTIKVVKNDQ